MPVEARENTLYLTAFAVIGIRKAFDICPLEVSVFFLQHPLSVSVNKIMLEHECTDLFTYYLWWLLRSSEKVE